MFAPKINLYHLLLCMAMIFILAFVYTNMVDHPIDPEILAHIEKESSVNTSLIERNQMYIQLMIERSWFFLIFSAIVMAIILWIGHSNRNVGKDKSARNRNRHEEKFQKYGVRSLNFEKRLKLNFACLTDNDIKVAKMLVDGLSSKEISLHLNISPASVNSARYRLRKRMALHADTKLLEFLRRI